MRLLVIGGTRFVGRHVVEAALAAGHDVTLFNRGRTGRAPAGTTSITGDRNAPADLAALAEVALAEGAPASGPFDATIDCCAFYPQQVGWLADALGEAAGRYVLISSISVYGGDDPPVAPGTTEDAPTLPAVHPAELPDEPGQDYGGLKVACEEVAADRFARVAVIRPGLVVGPEDHTGRFTYWVDRLADGGRVLCPGRPDRPVQVVDARDLGAFAVHVAAGGPDAVLHAVCPPRPFADVLADVGRAVGFEGELVWVDDDPLRDAGVAEWADLPLWLAAPRAGMVQVSADRALAAGLRPRPIAETASDIQAWRRSTGGATPVAGISRSREAELLVALAG